VSSLTQAAERAILEYAVFFEAITFIPVAAAAASLSEAKPLNENNRNVVVVSDLRRRDVTHECHAPWCDYCATTCRDVVFGWTYCTHNEFLFGAAYAL